MPVAASIRLARPGSSAPPPARRIFPRTTSSARFGGISDSISCTEDTIIATRCSSAPATIRPGTCSTRGVAARRVHADRFHPSGPGIGEPQVHLQVPGGVAADKQAEVGLDGVHDRLIHGVAAQAQRLGTHQVAACHHRDLGGPATDVHDERAGPVGRAEASPGGGGDRFLDELHVAPGLDCRGGHRQGSLFDPGGPAGNTDHSRRPQQAAAQAGPAQERLQHGHRPVQVGDDPVPQRVDDLDALRLLPGQDVRALPTAVTSPVARSTAIAEGSSITSPRPAT